MRPPVPLARGRGLTVLIPNCDYQIDFVCGAAINVLIPQVLPRTTATSGYHGEDRLIASDNAGTSSFATKAEASGDFATTALWTTSNGRTLVDDLNGGTSQTSAAHGWPPTSPTYRAGAARIRWSTQRHLLYHGQLVTAYPKFSGGNQQVLSTALSVYATSINFAGSMPANYAKSFVGLNTCSSGSGMDTYSVSASYGSSFGLSSTSSTTLTVMQLLVDLNANTAAGAARRIPQREHGLHCH